MQVGTQVTATRGNEVRLATTPFRPEGGGQAADVGWLVLEDGSRIAVVDVQEHGGEVWHRLTDHVPPGTLVHAALDEAHRLVLSRLHTAAHLLNALVFTRFESGLVNGARLRGDGTGRVDFDLPGVTADELRALQPALDDLVESDLPARERDLPLAEVLATPGLVRSLGRVPPSSPGGRVRVVEIGDVDRQACGGTHVARTGLVVAALIRKVDNKGRHHRRVELTVPVV